MRDYLEKLIEKRTAEIDELVKKSDASESIEEVRSISELIENIKSEIEEAKEALAKEEQRDEEPKDAEVRGMEIITGTSTANNEMEYRKAFMTYVLTGEKTAELRDNTTTANVAIPSYVADRIIDNIEANGMILPLVDRTAFRGGVSVSVVNNQNTATWVAEGAGSTPQAVTTNTVVFAYHKLRCELSMSMEVSAMSVPAFERLFIDKVAAAMTTAIENAIVNGTGSGQPKGILTETAPTALTVSGELTYQILADAEGSLPEKYEQNAKWFMSKKTFMAFVGMVDKNGQPIARVNYGIGNRPERYLLGREVILNPYTPTFDGKTANTFAFLFDPKGYMLNTVYDLGITRKQDWETEDMRTKAVMSVDGKVVDLGSLVTISNVAG